MQKKEFLKTDDGSYTIYLPDMEETYHSRHGAVTESNHVFIQNGLSLFLGKGPISVLEVGWGTGLNSLLAWLWAEENERQIEYLAIEPYPLKPEELLQLNYHVHIGNENTGLFFSKLHETSWEEKNQLAENFTFKKTKLEIEHLKLTASSIDIIFYDAFAPKKQPDMWDKNIFDQCYQWLSTSGLLTTYCANGQFKRDLKSCGFLVNNPKGPFGKREMTVAFKNQ